MNDYVKHILSKLTSGRWILTMISGIVFAYSAWKGILNAEAISAIITAVFMSYFNRGDRTKEENGSPK